MAYTPPLNITGINGMFTYVNDVTGGVFIIGLLLTIYLVPLIYKLLQTQNWLESSMVAGFLVTISAILLRVSGLMNNDKYVFLAIATIIVPLVFAFLKDKVT